MPVGDRGLKRIKRVEIITFFQDSSNLKIKA